MISLFGLKTCDTCRKALKSLRTVGHDVTFFDLREEADLSELLPDWIDAVGTEVLVNTRSTTWRGLAEAERGRRDTDPIGLLVDHPTLVKRPIIVAGDAVHVGWTPDTRAALSLS